MSLEVGSVVEGKITGITKFGAFVSLGEGKSGLVHISEITNGFVSEIKDFLAEGQTVKVMVINVDDKGRINLSIKRVMAEGQSADAAPTYHKTESFAPKKIEPHVVKPEAPKQLSFEEMMSKFKKDSDDKLADLEMMKETRKSNYAKRSHK